MDSTTPPPLSSLTPSPPSPCPTLSTPSLPSSPATPRSPPPPLSPPLALLPPPSPLSEVPMPGLTPTTTEDTTDVDTDSATGATDTVSDTAVDTTGVRFCQDVLDLDATLLPTFCPWIGSRGISNLL